MEHHRRGEGYQTRPPCPPRPPPLPSDVAFSRVSSKGSKSDSLAYSSSKTPAADPPRRHRRWSTWWFKEILAVVSSFVFQGAAIVILLCMVDKPYTRWNFFVSLNATIAIFTTAAKAALLLAVAACISQWKWLHFKSRHQPIRDFDIYDEASRGSLGSLVFLSQVRWGVPAIGAFVTILALGIDAFAQQVVILEPVLNFSPNASATFAFSTNYSSGAIPNAFEALNEVSVDFAMQGAILRGVYNLESPSLFNCSSTCKWDGPYYSVGFQSSCSNVTVATSATKSCTNGTDIQCTMQTPGGVTFNTLWVPTEVQTVSIVNTSTTSPIPDFDTTKPNFTMPSNITQFAVFRAPSAAGLYPTQNFDPNQGIIGEEIVECTIKVAGFKYSDIEAVGSTLNRSTVEVIPLDNATYTGYHTYVSLVFPGGTNGDFIMAPGDVLGVYNFFASPQFTGELQDGDATTKAVGTAGAFLHGNISDLVTTMAASMSDHVRSGTNQELGLGSAQETVLFVSVQWEWLSLPIVAEIATAVLLIATMVSSRRTTRVGLWKSSNVALLVHDALGSEGMLKADIQNADQLRDLSRGVEVKLE